DLCHGIVSVGMLADTVVIEQAMAVAEVDALGDRVHSLVSYRSLLWNRQPSCSRRGLTAPSSPPPRHERTRSILSISAPDSHGNVRDLLPSTHSSRRPPIEIWHRSRA